MSDEVLTMHAHVVLRDPDGREHELVHGDLVGRVWSAALQLDDGRVSEAHALVSLREGQLQLIALRGGLAVGGEPVVQVVLVPGQRVQLARGVELEVVEVNAPGRVLGIEADGLARQALPGVCSVVTDPEPRLARGWREDAALHAWTTGDHWVARPAGGDARAVAAGDRVVAGGVELRFLEIALRDAGRHATRRVGELDGPLRIVALYDTVHVYRPDGPPFVLGGMQARLVSELVAIGGPVSWGALSAELWPDEADPHLRRGRLDTLLSRVRRRLRAAGLRADLVRTDGSGTVELLLYPRDEVEDRT